MLGAAIIVFRETLEAALILGIVAAATRNVRLRGRWLIGGLAAGLAGSIFVAGLTGRIAGLAHGTGQELLNASVLGAATLMLGWHNIWMSRHGARLALDARRRGAEVADGTRALSVLAVVVALAVLREGSETVLFLYGLLAGGGEAPGSVAGGAAIGIVLGACVGWALYLGFVRIPARLFFSVTAGFILLLAAAMASQMARFLIQADLLPSLASPLWDTSWLLDDESLSGRVLHTLVGYEAQPSGMQVLFYVLTLMLIASGMHVFRVRRSSAVAMPTT